MKTRMVLQNIFCLMTLLLPNCKKEDNTTEIDTITSISGKIENWTSGSDKIIKICTYTKIDGSYTYISFGSSPVDVDGNFNILLTPPSDDLLIPIDSAFSDELNISDRSAKMLGGISFEIYLNNSNSSIGYVSKEKISNPDGDSVGDISVSYIYVTKSGSVTGSFTTNFFNSIWEININLNGKVGWNKYVKKITSIKGNTTTYKVTNIEPEGTKWVYHSIFD